MGANGAVIAGRGTYEAAGHWGGKNPWGIPFFVVTHRPAEQPPGDGFVFVGSLVEAIDKAKAAAGDKQVHVMGGADLLPQALADEGCAAPHMPPLVPRPRLGPIGRSEEHTSALPSPDQLLL